MDITVSFGSREYFIFLALLVFSRGMDFLSTWVATPNLALEGNPFAKKLGWKWGLLLNAVLVVALALSPFSAIVIATTSLLVAARNFQSAWVMRLLGEDAYRHWYVRRLEEVPLPLFLLCLAGNTLLVAAIGAALIYFGRHKMIVLAIGMGLIVYAIAVAFYSLLAIIRIRRANKRELERLAALQNPA